MASKRRSWPNVYRRVQRSGNASYVVDLGVINFKRERHSFKTKDEAETFADIKANERKNQGVAALTLPHETRVDAMKASALLLPYNVTMEEAAKHYLKHVLAYRNAPNVKKIVDDMVKDAEKNDRRTRTVGDIKNRLETFAEEFGERRLSEITVEEIKAWVSANE